MHALHSRPPWIRTKCLTPPARNRGGPWRECAARPDGGPRLPKRQSSHDVIRGRWPQLATDLVQLGISAPAPTSPIVSVRFPRSACPTRCCGAAARPSSPRAAPVWAYLRAANPWRSPGRSRSAVSARPFGARRLASAGFRLVPWCPVTAAWRPPRDALDGYGRSVVEAQAAARRVLAPCHVAWPCPGRANRPTGLELPGRIWTGRKRFESSSSQRAAAGGTRNGISH